MPLSKADKLCRIGIAGGIITALCCFTPVPVIIFGALGLTIFLGYLDYVLIPLLFFFLGMIGFGIWMRQKKAEQ